MKFPKDFILNHPELMIKQPDIAERFFSKIRFPEDREDECWIWTGKPSNKGYGQFILPDYYRFDHPTHDYKPHDVHRLMYRIVYGEILTPDDSICHKCDNRLCVNPFHLWKGTRSENTLDMHRKGRFKPPQKKLNESQVFLIQLCLSVGAKVAMIAKQFNVSESTIYKVKSGVY